MTLAYGVCTGVYCGGGSPQQRRRQSAERVAVINLGAAAALGVQAPTGQRGLADGAKVFDRGRF